MTRWSQEKIGKSDAFWAAAPLSGADVDQGAGADRHHRHHHPLPVSGEAVGARIAGLLFGELLEEQVESELLSGRKYWRNKTEIIEQLLIRGEGGSRTDVVAEVLKSFMGNSESNQQAGFFLDYLVLSHGPTTNLLWRRFSILQVDKEANWKQLVIVPLWVSFHGSNWAPYSEVGVLIRIDRSIQGRLYYGLKCIYIMQKLDRPRHYQLWCWQLWNRSDVLTPLMRGLLIHH